MTGASIGLVLRSKSVEVIQARRKFRGFQLAKVVSVPIPGTDDAQVVEAIRTAVANAGVTTTRVAVSVPSQDVLLRSFTMPLLPKSEWASAVQFEARKYLPFKTQELIWNFHAEEQRGAKQMSVAFVGVREETLDRLQGWLSAAGVTPAFIEAQSVSLARLAAAADQAPGRTLSMDEPKDTPASDRFVGVVDVDLEASVAHIVIARQHVPYFAREITLKFDRTAILEQAEGGAEEPSAEQSAMDPRAEVLLSELRLSIDFFKRENPQADINQLVLYGDQVQIGPWIGWLAEQLHCPVAIGTLPMTHAGGQPVNLHFACAVGLVLRQLCSTKIKLEFSDRRSAKAGRPAGFPLAVKLDPATLKGLLRPLVPQMVVALLLIVGLATVRGQQVREARQRLAETVQAFPDVGWDLKGKSLADLKRVKQQVDTHLQMLGKLSEQRVSVTEKLDALAKSLPQGVWLEGLNYQNRFGRGGDTQQVLTLRGAVFLPEEGGEMDVIRQFADQLKEDHRFSKGFASSQLGEVGLAEGGRQRVSYRTFKLNYHSAERKL